MTVVTWSETWIQATLSCFRMKKFSYFENEKNEFVN